MGSVRLRIASLDELGASSSAGRWSSPTKAENDRTGNANELLRSLVCKIKKETLSSPLEASQNCGGALV